MMEVADTHIGSASPVPDGRAGRRRKYPSDAVGVVARQARVATHIQLAALGNWPRSEPPSRRGAVRGRAGLAATRRWDLFYFPLRPL
jgi:hypothetical protein